MKLENTEQQQQQQKKALPRKNMFTIKRIFVRAEQGLVCKVHFRIPS